MGRFMLFILPGVAAAILFMVINALCVSEETLKEAWFDYLKCAEYTLSIIIPCILYYIKTPPGKMIKPD